MPKDMNQETAIALDRRSFLRGSGAGLVVCFTLTASSRAAHAAGGSMLGAYIQIASDNSVTVYVGATDMGQGILTGIAMLVAEELKVPWSSVSAVHAPVGAAYANPLFHAQLTGGSTSMRGWFTPMRKAAAVAREMLITAGAAALGQPSANCTAANGAVSGGGSSVPYAQIVDAAAALTPPDPNSVPLTTNFQVIGQRLQRVDIPAKVDGSAVFGIDVRLPGMAHAVVQHAPAFGATVLSMPSAPAGATLVNLGNAVGVVAATTWDAMRIANSLKVQWNIPADAASINSDAIRAAGQQLLTSGAATTMEAAGSADAGLAAAATKIDATYYLPYLAHACMEVLNCTASVTPTSCEIWAPTQGQIMCLGTAMALTGLPAGQITIHTTYLGGGLGRKIEQDFISQAIRISQAIGRPVKLTWPRPQDFRNDKYRPTALIRVQMGADAGGNLSMVYRNCAASISLQQGSTKPDTGAVAGATGLPYAIGNRRIEFIANPATVPLGYWRSVGESYNTFAVESAIDEMALALNKDPLALRQQLLANAPRELAVLNAVATLSNWSSAPPRGSARGLAFMSGFGSLIAEVVEISLDSAGRIRVNKVFCAIDCGTAVNPDSVEAQMQGGVAHGLAAALWGEVKFVNGAANVSNFNQYRIVKLGDMPQVTTKIINSGAAVGGTGETAVPCVAPAIANAYAKLTGVRIRNLPFYPGSTMGGL